MSPYIAEGSAGRAARPTPFRVRADGLSLRVTRQGTGPPLVLITGLGANIEMWAPLARLIEGREIIAFDPPGAGGSERTSRPPRMAGLADVVIALFDKLGLDQPDVLGYSFGGALAQELAHRAPGRLRRLILCATMPGIGGVPPNPLPALLLLSPARYYNAALLRLELPRIAGGRTAREPSSQLGWQAVARLCRPPDPVGYAYQLCAMTGWTSLPWLHRLTQPTLIVAGDDDPLIPVANAHLMGRLIPDARVCVLPGAGHLLLLDQPETVVDDIHAFLDE